MPYEGEHSDTARTKVQAGRDYLKLRETEVELPRGKKIPEACKQIGVAEQTHCR